MENLVVFFLSKGKENGGFSGGRFEKNVLFFKPVVLFPEVD